MIYNYEQHQQLINVVIIHLKNYFITYKKYNLDLMKINLLATQPCVFLIFGFF